MAEKRTVTPQEERRKRGRWVLPVLLAVSVLASLYFWFLS